MRKFPEITKEDAFRRMERSLIRRERSRLVKEGKLLPAYDMQPQLMVRNPNVEGGWSPFIGQFL